MPQATLSSLKPQGSDQLAKRSHRGNKLIRRKLVRRSPIDPNERMRDPHLPAYPLNDQGSASGSGETTDNSGQVVRPSTSIRLQHGRYSDGIAGRLTPEEIVREFEYARLVFESARQYATRSRVDTRYGTAVGVPSAIGKNSKPSETTFGKLESEQPVSSECSICRSEFAKEDPLLVLNCKHYFHKKCLDPWFEQGKRTCPMCRADVKLH